MRLYAIIIFFAIILFACSEENKKELSVKSEEISSDSNTDGSDSIAQSSQIEEIVNECHCFKGIGSAAGDKPILVYGFTNGKRVNVCGYAHENSEVISEFNVFDCETGKALLEFGAVESCYIKTYKDTLEIQLLKSLPVGHNWKWDLVQIGRQLITTHSDQLQVLKLEVKYNKAEIDSENEENFLNSLHKRSLPMVDWEDALGKLEVLSLNGNKRAWEILKEFDLYINSDSKPDGALAEEWKDALATVQWVTKNN